MAVLNCLEEGRALIVKDPDSALLKHLEPLFEMRKKQYDIKSRSVNSNLKIDVGNDADEP